MGIAGEAEGTPDGALAPPSAAPKSASFFAGVARMFGGGRTPARAAPAASLAGARPPRPPPPPPPAPEPEPDGGDEVRLLLNAQHVMQCTLNTHVKILTEKQPGGLGQVHPLGSGRVFFEYLSI